MIRRAPVLALLAASCASRPPAVEPPAPEVPSLTAQLAERKAAFEASAEPTVRELYEGAIAELRASGVVEGAKQVGEEAPNFILPDAFGGTTSLLGMLDDGPVVLLWYRGGWCPYCNLTLHAYGERLPEMRALGATLVAISPELPDRTLTTAERNGLGFEVLSDENNGVARDYGVLFDVPEAVWSRYQGAFQVDGYYSHGRAELPLGATYVIDRDATIVYAFLDADYRNRADPEAVLEVLRGLTP